MSGMKQGADMIAKLGLNRMEQPVVSLEQRQRFSDALNRVAGDMGLLIAIASLVAEDAPDVFTKLRSQIAEGDLPEAAATGHQLKGMLSTFETDGPVIVLQELIYAARNGDRSEADSALKRCESQILQLIDEIKSLYEADTA
jgi:hypothetical protein